METKSAANNCRKLKGIFVVSRKQPGWIAALAVIFVFLWSSPVWCEYSPTSGPYKVLTIENIELHDPARNKTIPIKIYYPSAAGQFPVIIFSHGALASKDAYSGLGEYWASYGYVSIHLSHADSVADSGFRGTLRQALSNPLAWENRPEDVSFIIDSLAHVENFAPLIVGKLDLHHIGVGGHSFGAYTAALIGGARILLPGTAAPRSFADSRVSVIVLLSPQGEGIMGLSAHSWDDVHVPMLLMYGSRDFGPFGEPPVWRSEAFAKGPAGNKYEVELEGGTHMGFAGLLRDKDHRVQVFQCAQIETLAFWDAYLKQDPKARQYLDSNGLEKFSGDIARFAKK